MKTADYIESIGVLLKEETLQTIDRNILENSLVLESLEPFPGYHGENLPQKTNPETLYLITDKLYPVEKIFRTSQYFCCNQQIIIDACPIEITINDSTLTGIRIRGLNDYALIAEFQRCYIKKGIAFMKKKKIKAPGLMRIIKIFSVEKLENFIYKDLEDDLTYYLSINYHFSWDLFKKVTRNVKNNMDNRNFDCASGYIYLKNLLEFVRVYAFKPDIGNLRTIREKYLEEIMKIREDTMQEYPGQAYDIN